MSWNDNGWNYWDDYNERDTEHVETISSKNIRTCKKNEQLNNVPVDIKDETNE